MKAFFRKWATRIVVLTALVVGILTSLLFNPSLSYAHSTAFAGFTVYHNQAALETSVDERMQNALAMCRASELYDASVRLELCLNDGSFYPAILKKLYGEGFAYGFYNKLVLNGTISFDSNYAELRGHKWNLEQLLAHEIIHCLQYRRFGLFGSNPVAGHPTWKWEGYAEYIARQTSDEHDLAAGIEKLRKLEQTDHNNWIDFADSTGSTLDYFEAKLLIQYCMEVEKKSFTNLLADTASAKTTRAAMLNWFNANRK